MKVLPRQALLEQRQLERFKRESQIASRLHHTNIVQVYEVGDEEGFHYYVMQYVRGVGLDKIIARLSEIQNGMAPAAAHSEYKDHENELLDKIVYDILQNDSGKGDILSQPQYYKLIASIGQQVADGLAYAHQQGTLH